MTHRRWIRIICFVVGGVRHGGSTATGASTTPVGLTPSASFPKAGTYVVALRATREGHDAVSYAVVRVADANRAPVLSAPAPAERSATVVVGNPRTFAIAAADPEGGAVSYAWLVDGAATGQAAASFTFAPTAAQVGAHVVEVLASDGTSRRRHTPLVGRRRPCARSRQ